MSNRLNGSLSLCADVLKLLILLADHGATRVYRVPRGKLVFVANFTTFGLVFIRRVLFSKVNNAAGCPAQWVNVSNVLSFGSANL